MGHLERREEDASGNGRSGRSCGRLAPGFAFRPPALNPVMFSRAAPRQLLSRGPARCYSSSTLPRKDTGAAPGVAATAGAPALPPRLLKRPLASNFGGIDIKNVSVAKKSAARAARDNGRNSSAHQVRRNDKSPNALTLEDQRYIASRKAAASTSSAWGDGLVSLNFSDRLKAREKKFSGNNRQGPAHSRPQNPTQGSAQGRFQDRVQGSQRVSAPRREQAAGRQATSATPAAKTKPQGMTRRIPSAIKTDSPAPTRTPRVEKSTTRKAERAPARAPAPNPYPVERRARLTALDSTNLTTLFGASNAPAVAGTALPARAATSARVRSVLERSAGDYSRFLPRRVGARKDGSRFPAMRTARHALAAQRDVSLEQRRVALHIIGGFAQPSRVAHA
ncbi:hypothetical protein BC834DRAFT_35858 [Gloeopeniophorella convolvens]|nr:hypothetical protein BC834DRAFT_35858 [Gloeopeniophorella convolvens]